MKHILKYSIFENETTDQEYLSALNQSFKLGLISNDQFFAEISNLLAKKKISRADLLRENITVIDFTENPYRDVDPDQKDWARGLFQEWTGPNGVRVLHGKVYLDEIDFQANLLLSNGDRLRLDWDGHHLRFIKTERVRAGRSQELSIPYDLYEEVSEYEPSDYEMYWPLLDYLVTA